MATPACLTASSTRCPELPAPGKRSPDPRFLGPLREAVLGPVDAGGDAEAAPRIRPRLDVLSVNPNRGRGK
jgi:hypothetical protein